VPVCTLEGHRVSRKKKKVWGGDRWGYTNTAPWDLTYSMEVKGGARREKEDLPDTEEGYSTRADFCWQTGASGGQKYQKGEKIQETACTNKIGRTTWRKGFENKLDTGGCVGVDTKFEIPIFQLALGGGAIGGGVAREGGNAI